MVQLPWFVYHGRTSQWNVVRSIWLRHRVQFVSRFQCESAATDWTCRSVLHDIQRLGRHIVLVPAMSPCQVCAIRNSAGKSWVYPPRAYSCHGSFTMVQPWFDHGILGHQKYDIVNLSANSLPFQPILFLIYRLRGMEGWVDLGTTTVYIIWRLSLDVDSNLIAMFGRRPPSRAVADRA